MNEMLYKFERITKHRKMCDALSEQGNSTIFLEVVLLHE